MINGKQLDIMIMETMMTVSVLPTPSSNSNGFVTSSRGGTIVND
jgi:hypothetical protein